MNRYQGIKKTLVGMLTMFGIAVTPAFAFNSGSTGVLGAFNPTVTTELEMPPDGIFNFTSVNIPAGVTVTFKRNTTNTPVVVLASENVFIATGASINVSGGHAKDAGTQGDGNFGDDGIPGKGGPGGYDGGAGGVIGPATTAAITLKSGGAGSGPGGGAPGVSRSSDFVALGAGGAGFAVLGGSSNTSSVSGAGGAIYGSSLLLPLVGGSGGGGGAGGNTFRGAGGGGGGGALLIAATGTVTINGSITANGGFGGSSNGTTSVATGSPGGGGSGGAIRIVASTIHGNGPITAIGGSAGGGGACNNGITGCSGSGAPGRVRWESDVGSSRTANSNPVQTSSTTASPVFVAGLPTLRITTVAGVATPAEPTGNADVTLPANTPNPVTVGFATTGVPVGNTVKLTVKPAGGAVVVATSPALSGTTNNASASVNINLPSGPSVLEAEVSYTVIASVGDDLSKFAKGERVEKVTLSASLTGPSMITLTTVSGKEYTMPSSMVAGILGS